MRDYRIPRYLLHTGIYVVYVMEIFRFQKQIKIQERSILSCNSHGFEFKTTMNLRQAFAHIIIMEISTETFVDGSF